MNGFELHNRIKELDEYLETISRAINRISTYNEEFGEGNPDVYTLETIAKGYQSEKENLEDTLRNMQI